MIRSVRAAVLRQQRAWAESRGHVVDERGYLKSVEDNLVCQALSETVREGLAQGRGSELRDRGNRPAKMRALLSSAALAVNVFDYWSAPGSDRSPLQVALGLAPEITSIEFEGQFCPLPDRTPANLDVVLTLRNGVTVAIESKFCEWMTRRSRGKAAFAPAYFPDARDLWGAVRLHRSQALAGAINQGRERFLYLDVAQLLKHALGLARELGDGFVLWYLYFDGAGPAADQHRAEIARFADMLEGEVGFRAISYQDVFARLRTTAGSDHERYLTYLGARYFPGVEVPHAGHR